MGSNPSPSRNRRIYHDLEEYAGNGKMYQTCCKELRVSCSLNTLGTGVGTALVNLESQDLKNSVEVFVGNHR